jgi:hypothetical protein
MQSENDFTSAIDYPPSEEGRCRSCGFLANRAMFAFDTPWGEEFFEIGQQARRTGHAPTYGVPGRRTGSGLSAEEFSEKAIMLEHVCYRGVADFQAELRRTRAKHKWKVIFDRDRHCPKWFPYSPGVTPKIHMDKVHMLELEQSRQAFESRMQAENQATQTRMLLIAGTQALLAIIAIVVGVLVTRSPDINITNVAPTMPPTPAEMITPGPT